MRRGRWCLCYCYCSPLLNLLVRLPFLWNQDADALIRVLTPSVPDSFGLETLLYCKWVPETMPGMPLLSRIGQGLLEVVLYRKQYSICIGVRACL